MTMKLNDGFKAPVAVVDWVAFEVELNKRSHGGYLKNTYSKYDVSYAKPLDKGDGGAASKFEIRLQNPANYGRLSHLVAEVKNDYGLASEPKLLGIEVSLDFYHTSHDLTALKSMTESLMLGITPTIKYGNPRLIGKKSDHQNECYPFKNGVDADRTFYFGNDGDDLMWRVYLKRTDDTFIGDEGKREPKPLPPSEYRARVEVSITGNALAGLGLEKLSDLQSFRYERLYSAGLFKFTKRDLDSVPLRSEDPRRKLIYEKLGVTDKSPACILNKYNRRDARHREKKLSLYLVTDKKLSEASRQALRRLTARF